MGRLQRFIPENEDGVLVEITCRTVGAQAQLVPSPNPRLFNEMVVGVMGRALEVSPLEVCGVVVLGNHVHQLLVVRTQQELTRYMQHFGCNLTKEVNRVRRRTGSMWSRRYDAIVVSPEPEAQWGRLRYLLSNSVKEGLCSSPMDWPGVHAARALVHGEKLEGYWFNRSKEWVARNQGTDYGTYDFATGYRVGFAQLPAFRDLAPDRYRDRVAELILEIEEEGERSRDGRPAAGVEKILSQNPFEPPTRRPKRSPRPMFHVKGREATKALWHELRAFLARYLEASEELRSGPLPSAAKRFPEGCYPPALPFVGEPAPPCPPAPPTRRIEELESGIVLRGEIPVVEPPVALFGDPRPRGQPP